MSRHLKRSESYFGVHFDFHATIDCKDIGKNTTPEMVQEIIDIVKPDFIQCDCKGHPGFSSYPTKAGHQAPGIVNDALRIWRDVTAANDIALYMHYSGVWDTEAVKHHLSWARVDENGSADRNNTSVFGPYVDELLIPQLKELRDEYGVDGIWLDGECWATCHDYGPKVIEMFREKTGIQEIPFKKEDLYFYEFTEFCREGFKEYLRHYTSELHKYSPDYQIASNWSFTSLMPEPVSAGVDFISGDYTLQDSLNSARFEGRCIARQGKPWDLMAWGFSGQFPGEQVFSIKSAVQLKQEAAGIIALGGGFQVYLTQKEDGSISRCQLQPVGEVAEFCRARQEFCHKAEAVPQIALLYSGACTYRKNARLFGPWGGTAEDVKGILRCLLDSQNAVEILMEHHLKGRMNEYPLIIIPEWDYIEDSFKNELLSYVENGGKLLVIGPKAAEIFETELGIAFDGETEVGAERWLEFDGRLAGFKTTYSKVRLNGNSRQFGKVYKKNDNIGQSEAAATIASYGNGLIAAVYFNMGKCYMNGSTSVARDFLNGLVHELFPDPIIEVKGLHYVDVIVNRINGKLAVNLINTSGPHANKAVYVFDEIPPIGPLDITVRIPQKPSSVILEPEGTDLQYIYEEGILKLTLSRIEIHSIIVIE